MWRASVLLFLAAACAPVESAVRAPQLTPAGASPEVAAMSAVPFDLRGKDAVPGSVSASLWEGDAGSLFGDDRARARGDILTVVIEIDETAELRAESDRRRTDTTQSGINGLGGLPEVLGPLLPTGTSLGSIVDVSGAQRGTGSGSASRSGDIELRVAATVTDVLPNGALAIAGSQEVRVNFELRELLVTGYVRPKDISRRNEVTYDKIAAARISYGGRGRVSEVQQPRYGHRVLDSVLPF